MACSNESESIRQDLIRRRNASEAALRGRLECAQQEGDIPATADCGALASYVMAVKQGMAVQAKAGTPKAILDAIVAHVLATWPS
jgi:hypothetical protein